ncbi:ABC transporter ATP-binding protein [Clostridium sp. HCP1S3_B4]|uniref:ABC transporter ATP-binding protein n=1 Tax=unclassified Clostridium TaxID=2614128 RepID=UPI0016B62243|nr:ABC transporter ATP-binding protein [Clostridiales bacterium]
MLKLVKYLKDSVFSVILIILLLVLQSVCDLSLPDYTSKIVNVGIQQGGIEEAVPDVITKSDLDNVLLFVDNDDKEKILDNYDYLDKEELSDSKLSDYKEKYPLIEDEPLYEIKDINEDERKELEDILKKPMVALMAFDSSEDMKDQIKTQLLSNMPEQAQAMYNDKDVFDILKTLPQEAVSGMKESMDEKLDEMQDSILDQSAVSYVKSEYEKIGLDMGKIEKTYLFKVGGIMLGIAFVSMAAAVLSGFIASKVAAKIGKNLRGKVFKRVMEFSNEEMDKFSTASLITRSTNDIQQVQLLMVMLLKIVFYAPIIGIGGIIKVFNTNLSMSWIIGVAVGAILLVVAFMFIIVMPKFKIVQNLVDRLNLVSREILTGLSVIRAFSTEKYEEKRFDKANRDLTKVNLFVNRVMSCMMPVMMFIMNGIAILIVWNGSKSVDAGTMQVGDMMAFIQYTMQIIMAFLMISMISVMLPRAAVSAGRIDEVIDTKPTILDPEKNRHFEPSKKGVLEFNNVSFRYPQADEDVLSNISFTAKPGETTAFIGSTGSGKTTLINLIPRFYDVTKGEILLDGVNVKDVSQHDLREKIGYVPQKGVLFSGTIESNLKYGRKDANIDEIKKASSIAQATEFIEAKEEKYNSPIAQGGSNVSGGQKQRLSIARAIVKRPEFYIFDDSFSALDFKTDAALRKALNKETGNSTVLIVAQRISTILHADQIIVLDEGKIVGKGTHKELLKNCEVYKEIASSQLSKEELENE